LTGNSAEPADKEIDVVAWSFKNILVSDSNLSAVEHVEDLHERE
jgi:hypothetical protein